jgi:hypothetical protein
MPNWYAYLLAEISFLDHSSIGILPHFTPRLHAFSWKPPQAINVHLEELSLPCSYYLQTSIIVYLF